MRLLEFLFQLPFLGRRKDGTHWHEWIATECSFHWKGQVYLLSPFGMLASLFSLPGLNQILISKACVHTPHPPPPDLLGPGHCAFIGVNVSFIKFSFQRGLCEAFIGMPLGDAKKSDCWVKAVVRLWIQISDPERAWGVIFLKGLWQHLKRMQRRCLGAHRHPSRWMAAEDPNICAEVTRCP